MRLDNRVLDQYADGGAFLRKTLRGAPPPDLLKYAADMSDTEHRHAADYALAVATSEGPKYLFPVVDPGNTVMSAMYFGKYAEYMPASLRTEVREKIATALAGFGIDPKEFLAKSAEHKLGYTDERGDLVAMQSLEEMFGVGTADSMYEKIEDEFTSSSPRGRQRLMYRIKEAGLDTTRLPSLSDYAGSAYGRDFGIQIGIRKSVTGYDGDAVMVLDEMFEKRAGISTDGMIAALERFDDAFNLTHKYGRCGLKDPVASVLGSSQYDSAVLEKKASAEWNGVEYTAEDLMALTQNQEVTSTFDADLLRQMAADPVGVFSSLPITVKQALAAHL